MFHVEVILVPVDVMISPDLSNIWISLWSTFFIAIERFLHFQQELALASGRKRTVPRKRCQASPQSLILMLSFQRGIWLVKFARPGVTSVPGLVLACDNELNLPGYKTPVGKFFLLFEMALHVWHLKQLLKRCCRSLKG